MSAPTLPDPEMAERLKLARAYAGYPNAAAGAKAMEIDYPTYAGHENGNRGFSKSVSRYARFYKVRGEWLLTGRGKMTNEPVLDVFERIPPEKHPQAMEYLNFLATTSKRGQR